MPCTQIGSHPNLITDTHSIIMIPFDIGHSIIDYLRCGRIVLVRSCMKAIGLGCFGLLAIWRGLLFVTSRQQKGGSTE